MEFIINSLALWAVLAVASGAFAVVSQARRMKRFMGSASSFDFEASHKAMTEGLGLTAMAGFVCVVSTILFLVAVVGALVS